MSNTPPENPNPENPYQGWAAPDSSYPYSQHNPQEGPGVQPGVAGQQPAPASDPYQTYGQNQPYAQNQTYGQGQPYGQNQPYAQHQPQQPYQAPSPFNAPPPDHSMAFPVMQKAKIEPLVVASIATFWTGLIGLILGIIGLRRTKQRGTRSPGLAITGIALSTIITAIAAATVIVFATNGTFARMLETPQAGDLSEQTISSTNLAAGNCIGSLPPGNEVGDIKVVPCTEDHHAQVVSTQALDADEFPGANEVASLAETACDASIQAVLTEFEDATIEPWYIVPSEAGWKNNDTTAMCLIRTTAGPLVEDYIN